MHSPTYVFEELLLEVKFFFLPTVIMMAILAQCCQSIIMVCIIDNGLPGL